MLFTELVEEGAEVFREGGFEGAGFAGGVGELEAMGVKGEAGEDGAVLFFGFGELEVSFDGREEDGFAVAVEVVAGDGVADGLHVDADLVGAAGMDSKLE